jgi:flavin-dependent dehydrogenase
MLDTKLKVVVVGGAAAGPTAASAARRKDSTLGITLLEKGEFISYAA